MLTIANTPKPPYYAVIFTSLLTDETKGYAEMADKMEQLATQQKGFLGIESARESVGESMGISVSYWTDLESIKNWKANSQHQIAQKLGHEKWYASFKTRISKVERDYGV